MSDMPELEERIIIPPKRVGEMRAWLVDSHGMTEPERRLAAAETALRNLVEHHDAMSGPRAHRLGCQCGGGNDGVHFCSTLEQAFADAKQLLSRQPT